MKLTSVCSEAKRGKHEANENKVACSEKATRTRRALWVWISKGFSEGLRLTPDCVPCIEAKQPTLTEALVSADSKHAPWNKFQTGPPAPADHEKTSTMHILWTALLCLEPSWSHLDNWNKYGPFAHHRGTLFTSYELLKKYDVFLFVSTYI